MCVRVCACVCVSSVSEHSTQMCHRHVDILTHRHTYKSAIDTQTQREQTHIHICHRHTDTQTHRHIDTQIHRHTGTQTHRHIDAQTHTHTCHRHADT